MIVISELTSSDSGARGTSSHSSLSASRDHARARLSASKSPKRECACLRKLQSKCQVRRPSGEGCQTERKITSERKEKDKGNDKTRTWNGSDLGLEQGTEQNAIGCDMSQSASSANGEDGGNGEEAGVACREGVLCAGVVA